MALFGRQLNWQTSEEVTQPYAQNGTLHAALKLKARAVTQAVPQLWDSDPQKVGKKARVISPDSDPLAAVFASPNPMHTMSQFFELGMIHRTIDGADYWLLLGDGDKPISRPGETPKRFVPCRGQSVSFRTNSLGWPVEYRISFANGGSQPVPPHALLAFLDPDPDNQFAGLGDVEVLKNELDTEWQIFRMQRALIQNGGDPGGWIEGLESLAPEEQEGAAAEIREEFGVAHAGEIKLKTTRGKYVPNKLGPREMEFPKLLNEIRTKIATVLHVPLPLLQVLEHATYNNTEIFAELLWKGGCGILGYLQTIEDVVNNKFLRRLTDPRQRTYVFRFDTSAIEALQQDREATMEGIGKLLALGVGYSKNELYKIFKLEVDDDEVEFGDVRLVPMGKTTLERVISGENEEELFGDEDEDPDEGPKDDDEPKKPDDEEEKPKDDEKAATIASTLEVSPGVEPVARAFDDDGNADPLNIDPADVEPLLLSISEWREKLAKAMRDDIKRIFALALGDIQDELGTSMVSPVDANVVLFLSQQVIQLAEGHTTVLAERVRSALVDGLSEATNITTLQEMVAEVLPEIEGRLAESFSDKQARALLIARTETAHAFNGARYMEMTAAGVAEHEWITSRDDNVRGAAGGIYEDAEFSHAELEGVVVRVGELFDAEKHPNLRHPSDPDAEPGDTINCRCQTRPMRVDDDKSVSTYEERTAYWTAKEAAFLRTARKSLAAKYKGWRQRYEKAQIEKLREFAGVKTTAGAAA